MQAARAGINAYRQMEAEATNPNRMVVMAVEGIAEYMRRAELAFDAEDKVARTQALWGATQIVAHLIGALDKEKGGEIAENLERLYNFLLMQFGKASVQDDRTALDACKPVVQNLYDAWSGIS